MPRSMSMSMKSAETRQDGRVRCLRNVDADMDSQTAEGGSGSGSGSGRAGRESTSTKDEHTGTSVYCTGVYCAVLCCTTKGTHSSCDTRLDWATLCVCVCYTALHCTAAHHNGMYS